MKGISVMELGTIVPIVLAILLFFGSVVSALDMIQKKNQQIDAVVSVVQIVDRLTEAGVLTQDRFNKVAKTLSETLPVNFYICVTSYDDDEYTRCSLKTAKPDFYAQYNPSSLLNQLGKGYSYISTSFPVTYQIDIGGVPFNEINRMLVIVWQRV